MKEKLLQYLWNFKIFNSFDFTDVAGKPVEIIDFGKWNFDSGPDFLFGKIKFQGVTLVGHIELHIRSSDYIFHRHTGNPEFENLILHVVYFHDADIPELVSRNIPTLELKNYIDETVLDKYASLENAKVFIPCEEIFNAKKIPFQFEEETLLKKLDHKSLEIEIALAKNKNNYEAVLFQNIAYAFGLKVNAQIFRQLAENIDFSVLNKVRQNLTQLEAFFFGMCGWLQSPDDEQTTIWKRELDFLVIKYQLKTSGVIPKFSKLRPPSFPTVRLAQLASLYHLNQNLFSKVMTAKSVGEIVKVFRNVVASPYWNDHFNFGKVSTTVGEKILTDDFISLIIINAILPLKYTYQKNSNENITDEIIAMYRSLPAEKNTVIENWKALKTPIRDALDSQAFLFHFQHYCQPKRCLECAIGFQLLKHN